MLVEYVLLNGVNDSEKVANELGELLQSKNVTINLIPYNNTSSSIKIDYLPTETKDIESFKEILRKWLIIWPSVTCGSFGS